MKVICAGMSKTGTTTMNAALTLLGYSVYDYMENYEYLCEEWTKAVEVGWTRGDLKAMFKDVDATCDAPAFYFWKDLLDAFPDAKVVLTVRDNDEVWLDSIDRQQSLYAGIHLIFFYFLSPTFRRFTRYSLLAGLLPFGTSDALHVNRTTFKQNYRRHNAHVLHDCPKSKLLVYNCKEGWAPLCQFLGKQVPDVPFPHKNIKGKVADDVWESSVFKKTIKECYFSFGTLAIIGTICTLRFIKWI